MPDTIDPATLEKTLAGANATPKDLLDLFNKVAIFKQFKPKRLFPNGTINPDVLEAHFDLAPQEFEGLGKALLANRSPLIRQWKVFPFGVVNPERFHVEVQVGKARRL